MPGLEDLTGLKAGVHYMEWSTLADLQRQIKKWRAKRYDQKRADIAAAGRAFVHEHHSFDKRVAQLFDELLPALLGEAV